MLLYNTHNECKKRVAKSLKTYSQGSTWAVLRRSSTADYKLYPSPSRITSLSNYLPSFSPLQTVHTLESSISKSEDMHVCMYLKSLLHSDYLTRGYILYLDFLLWNVLYWMWETWGFTVWKSCLKVRTLVNPGHFLCGIKSLCSACDCDCSYTSGSCNKWIPVQNCARSVMTMLWK